MAVPTWIVSLVVVRRLPPCPSYTETEIWTASPCCVGGRLKPSWPLNSGPPFTEDKTVFVEPKAMFEVVSYALPVA